MNPRIDKFVESNKTALIEDIKNLIAFESLLEKPEETYNALDYVLLRAADMGMITGKTVDGKAGYAQIGEGDVTLGILVHVDVVGIGDKMKWTHPPFVLSKEGDYLYGRGIVDDKGPVIMSLYAMKALLDLNLPLQKKIRLIVGTSEESQWTDMDSYKEEFGQPDYSYSPDGEFPVYNIEKGYCDIILTFSDKALINFDDIASGDSPNTIPSKAVLKKQGEAAHIFQGVSVHSSTPDKGDNAILKLAKVAEEKGLHFGSFVSKYFTNHNHGKPLEVDDGLDTYNGIYVGDTIASPTFVSLTQQKELLLNVNLRIKVGTGRKEVEAAFERLSSQYFFTYKIRNITDGFMVDTDMDFLKKMNSVYENYGYTGDFMVADGATYSGTMRNCVSWGPVFLGDESCAHIENERMNTISMLKATKLYCEYLALVGSQAD